MTKGRSKGSQLFAPIMLKINFSAFCFYCCVVGLIEML